MSSLIFEEVNPASTPKQMELPAETDTTGTMKLKDGRTLGFAQYGDPAGEPVFFFHGSAGSRLEHPANLCALGARIICTDRPGHGLSDFQPNRTLLDWPDDVAQLADQLGINKFYVLGWSAGGPHALACAYQLPERVLASAVAASPGPMSRPGAMKELALPARASVIVARKLPLLGAQFRKMARNTVWGDPEQAKKQLLASIPDDDKDNMLKSGNLDMMFADVREGYRQGWQGIARDDRIILGDWGFDIADINVRIDIWYGERDSDLIVHASEYMRSRISYNRSFFLSREGHFFLLNYWGRVVQTLMAD